MVKKRKKREKKQKKQKEKKCRECGRPCLDGSGFCSSLCRLEANLRKANTAFSTDRIDAGLKKSEGGSIW